MFLRSTVTILITAVAIAACSNTKEVEVVGEVPAPRDLLSDLYRIVAVSDYNLQSRLHVNGDTRGWPTDCFWGICVNQSSAVGIGPTVATANISRQAIKRDRLVQDLPIVVSSNDHGEWTAYGAWMDHAAFFASRLISPPEPDGTPYVISYGEVFGTVSEEPLPAEGTATWRGAMVGQNVTTHDRYIGAANLVATFGAPHWIDIYFSGIANVETGATHEDISFERTTLTPRSEFLAWQPGDVTYDEAPIYVRGRLLGLNHAEAAGVFGYNELIGAFGAKRQE